MTTMMAAINPGVLLNITQNLTYLSEKLVNGLAITRRRSMPRVQEYWSSRWGPSPCYAVAMRRSSGRPNREFVAAGVPEVESPATGKLEDHLGNLAACLLNPGQCPFELIGVQDDQRPARRHLRQHAQSAGLASLPLPNASVFRPVVGELPVEGRGVETLGLGHVSDPELDVVDFVMATFVL